MTNLDFRSKTKGGLTSEEELMEFPPAYLSLSFCLSVIHCLLLSVPDYFESPDDKS